MSGYTLLYSSTSIGARHSPTVTMPNELLDSLAEQGRDAAKAGARQWNVSCSAFSACRATETVLCTGQRRKSGSNFIPATKYYNIQRGLNTWP